MIKLVKLFMALAITGLAACKRPCPSGSANAIHLVFVKDSVWGWAPHRVGYKEILHVERDQVFDSLFSFVVDSNELTYTYGQLPLDIEASRSTYILSGDSISDTLIVTYRPVVEYTSRRCDYTLSIRDFQAEATFTHELVTYDIEYGFGSAGVFQITVQK